MLIKRQWRHAARYVLIGLTTAACVAGTVAAVAQPSAAAPLAQARSSSFVRICWSGKGDTRLANRLSRGIERALRGRPSPVAVRVKDPRFKINCYYRAGHHFYSASAVKATILAALLRKAHEQHRSLTSYEKHEAYLMITQSDNNAATYLWNDVGMHDLQRFLDKARMRHTRLGAGGLWGLTRITAHDETLLLWLLLRHNHVLTNSARRYELRLMAHVVSYEDWGVSAGAPTNFTVHLKNGWAPLPQLCCSPWVVNSIGAFTNHNAARDYTMVVLTYHNGSEGEGITTIQAVARRVNYDLTPHARHLAAIRGPFPSTPDETLPTAG